MNRTALRSVLATSAVAVTLLGLTACSSADTQDKTSATPKPTATATAPAVTDEALFGNLPEGVETHEASCVDGKATIDQPNAKVVLAGDCDLVTITAGNSVVQLGKVGTLVIDGDINGVAAKTIGSLELKGGGNSVLADNAPKTTGDTKDNRIEQR